MNWKRFQQILAVVGAGLLAACNSSDQASSTSSQTDSTTDSTTASSSSTATSPVELPTVASVAATTDTVAKFGRLDLTVELDAVYDNPYDQRQISLDAMFTAPTGDMWTVPGFWDGRETWGFRFTPPAVGDWTYSVTATDSRGTSQPTVGGFTVTESDAKGFIRPANWVDESLSPHYFAFDDGTPWFGFGHADLSMGFSGFSGSTFKKMNEMADAGENLEMWWPLWAMNYIQLGYDNYSADQMQLIDLVINEAEKNDIAIVYTIWNHQLLRTNQHPWRNALWASNGFNQLVDNPAEFFTDDEAWAWQENMYRYTIARWGYSTAIAMWQTVTEINGTESYDQTDPWHERLNSYFQDNDPYRHPTSATKSGGQYWPTAYEVMDVPQMHVYEQFHANPVEAAKIMADWTAQMWTAEEKPNWIGEYGERIQRVYPEFHHNSSWATIAAGAATGPFEWNDDGTYNVFDDEMVTDQARLAAFVATIPLAAINPHPIAVSSTSAHVRGWGVAGALGGLVWAQDFTFESTLDGEPEDIDAIRARGPQTGVVLTLEGIAAGSFTVSPYNTWTGEWIADFSITCDGIAACSVPLPTFTHDIALRVSAE